MQGSPELFMSSECPCHKAYLIFIDFILQFSFYSIEPVNVFSSLRYLHEMLIDPNLCCYNSLYLLKVCCM